jgi:hypothetical protein
VARRILTFNCHEPYVHHLAKLGYPLDVVDGLPGRYVKSWDTKSRPVPQNVTLIQLNDIYSRGPYLTAICHNVSDLIAIKHLDVPRILILHVSLQGRVAEEGCSLAIQDMQYTVRTYLRMVGGVVVAVSKPKLTSWGVEGTVIEPPVDPDEYGDYTGELPEGIRVSNLVSKRARILAWDVHQEIVRNIPLLHVGYNPDITGVEPARDWDHLRHLLRTHRFYLHTSDPDLEDGYNLALLEAMGTGLPVVATCSPTSPVVDGQSGFISDNVEYLRWGIQQLLSDPQLAFQMGERGRQVVLERFSVSRFLESWHETIGEARARQQRIHRKPKKFAH